MFLLRSTKIDHKMKSLTTVHKTEMVGNNKRNHELHRLLYLLQSSEVRDSLVVIGKVSKV